jgi:uncharacterized protein (TIGR02271 family)
MQMEELQQLQGSPVFDSTGDQIGKVEEIHVDTESNRPEWIGLGTGFLGTKRVLVPVQGARPEGEGLSVPYEKRHVQGAPDLDDDQISSEAAGELYAYYGIGGNGQTPSRGGEGGQSVTRHEEELSVGKQEVETGRARLRKWVETEPVAMDVELKQESARVTREAIDKPADDAEIGEDSIEVPLRGERAVVQKQTVAKERVGIETDVATEHQTVQDEVRKERVEPEGDDA